MATTVAVPKVIWWRLHWQETYPQWSGLGTQGPSEIWRSREAALEIAALLRQTEEKTVVTCDSFSEISMVLLIFYSSNEALGEVRGWHPSNGATPIILSSF